MRDVTGRYWVCQSLWDSFLYLGNLHWFLYLLLSYFYDHGMFIFRWSSNFLERVVLKGILRCLLLLYIEWIWTNYCKLSRNFVGAITTTTINCRVSFIHLYLVFPRNFRIVFLPHTNTVIVLELYCGTITETGLPVIFPTLFQTWSHGARRVIGARDKLLVCVIKWWRVKLGNNFTRVLSKS